MYALIVSNSFCLFCLGFHIACTYVQQPQRSCVTFFPLQLYFLQISLAATIAKCPGLHRLSCLVQHKLLKWQQFFNTI